MKRALLWWLANGVAAALLYFGYFRDVGGARNLFLFMVWFNFVVCVGLMFSATVQKSVREKGRSVPAWISVPYDIAMLSVMVWTGMWFTSVAWTFSAFIHNAVLMQKDSAEEKAAA